MCRVTSGSQRVKPRVSDRRVTVKRAVPKVHRRLDLAERERPRALEQGEFLHRSLRPRPERVSDGLVFDPQGGVRSFRRGGRVAAQAALPLIILLDPSSQVPGSSRRAARGQARAPAAARTNELDVG